MFNWIKQIIKWILFTQTNQTNQTDQTDQMKQLAHSGPVYTYIDECYLTLGSTNHIEGIILMYYSLEPKEINDYSRGLINEGSLISSLRHNKEEHDFLVKFLNRCIDLTE